MILIVSLPTHFPWIEFSSTIPGDLSTSTKLWLQAKSEINAKSVLKKLKIKILVALTTMQQ